MTFFDSRTLSLELPLSLGPQDHVGGCIFGAPQNGRLSGCECLPSLPTDRRRGAALAMIPFLPVILDHPVEYVVDGVCDRVEPILFGARIKPHPRGWIRTCLWAGGRGVLVPFPPSALQQRRRKGWLYPPGRAVLPPSPPSIPAAAP